MAYLTVTTALGPAAVTLHPARWFINLLWPSTGRPLRIHHIEYTGICAWAMFGPPEALAVHTRGRRRAEDTTGAADDLIRTELARLIGAMRADPHTTMWLASRLNGRHR